MFSKLTLIVFALFAFGCSHHGHDHGHGHGEGGGDWKAEHAKMKEEHKKIQKEHDRALRLLSWFKDQIQAHEKELQEHEAAMAKHENADLSGNTMASKKAKLQIGRLHAEMTEKHHHFQEDHEKLNGIVDQLEELKKEFESHDHDH